MKLIIDIPEEFEEHFNTDRFEDTLHRLSADAHLLAGNYEQETAIMLIDAFKNGTPLPKGHGKIIDINSFNDYVLAHDSSFQKLLQEIPTIIEADKEVEE